MYFEMRKLVYYVIFCSSIMKSIMDARKCKVPKSLNHEFLKKIILFLVIIL